MQKVQIDVVFQQDDFRVVTRSDTLLYHPQILEDSILQPGTKTWHYMHDDKTEERIGVLFLSQAKEFNNV